MITIIIITNESVCPLSIQSHNQDVHFQHIITFTYNTHFVTTHHNPYFFIDLPSTRSYMALRSLVLVEKFLLGFTITTHKN